MKVLFKNKISGKIWEDEYNNIDINQPIIGLDKNIEIYYINENKSKIDENKYNIVFDDDYELIDEQHNDYKHLKICNKIYKSVEKTVDEIVQKLNDDLGTYLDNEYPLWERAKHAGEGNYILLAMINNTITKEQMERKEYIDNIYNWITNCRKIRQQREDDYINKNIFPEFDNYPLRP